MITAIIVIDNNNRNCKYSPDVWLSLVLWLFVQGSTDTMSYSTQGVNDAVTAALHIIIGDVCCVFSLLLKASANASCFWTVCPPLSFVCQDRLPWYLLNTLNSFHKTYSKYSLAPNDDLVRFWRSKVKVSRHRGGERIHFDAVASKSIF